ncbi:hypothetical protein AMTRI_Chr02g266400 [Amborella trichopoda]
MAIAATICPTLTIHSTPKNLSKNSDHVPAPKSVSLLEMCKDMKELCQVHSQFIKSGHINDKFTVSRILALSALSDFGNLHYSRLIFYHISKPNSFIWNTMIRGCVQHGSPEEAILMYIQLLQSPISPNELTFPSVLKVCSQLQALEEGKQVHAQVTKFGFGSDGFVQNSLIHMYSMCHENCEARTLFDKSVRPDIVSWTSMVCGYAKLGMIDSAFELFEQMPEKNSVSWDALIFECSRLGRVEMVDSLFQRMPRRTLNSWNSMLFCHANFGSVLMARSLFDKMLERNEFSWHTMISAYVDNGLLEQGHQLFGQMPCRDVVAWHLILSGYMKQGEAEIAQNLFYEMPERNVISWNTMVAGFVRNSRFEEALLLFQEMQKVSEVKPNNWTLLSILSACTSLGALDQGQWIHAYIERNHIRKDAILGTALIDMYSKCGAMGKAQQVFHESTDKDIGMWNAMISGLGHHGHGREAIELLSEMLESNVKPNAITFVGLLSACSHAGLVDEGLRHFSLMSEVYNINPGLEHYGCMVDLLSRAGFLFEAKDFIESLPLKPSIKMWGALLTACMSYSNLELGEYAAKQLMELDPEDSGNYVTLSNMYASKEQWAKVVEVREEMKKKGLKKTPGCSMFTVNGFSYKLLVGDRSHDQREKVYSMLEEMGKRLKEAGHVADPTHVHLRLNTREKEIELAYHSEKLALAFGLISTKPGTRICIFKNLRICGDCHSAIKHLSKIYNREIVVRDQSRFHCFKDGSCSCMEFW